MGFCGTPTCFPRSSCNFVDGDHGAIPAGGGAPWVHMWDMVPGPQETTEVGNSKKIMELLRSSKGLEGGEIEKQRKKERELKERRQRWGDRDGETKREREMGRELFNQEMPKQRREEILNEPIKR